MGVPCLGIKLYLHHLCLCIITRLTNTLHSIIISLVDILSPFQSNKLVDDRSSSHFNFCLPARSLHTPVPFEFSSKASISQQDGQQNGWLYENLDLTYVIIEITRELPHNNFYKIISKTKKAYIHCRDVPLLG